MTLPEINGGLFAPDALIDGLSIPNHVFAKAGQGANEASLESDTTRCSTFAPDTTMPHAAT